MPWSDATLVTRAFPGAYFVFIAVFYTWRILLLGRRAGASPVHKGERGSAGRRHHVRFVAMRAAILVLMLARAAFPAVDRWLVPLGPMWHTPVMLGGDALLLLSFLGVLLLHFGLGAEWRSGIAPEGPARLRTGGPLRPRPPPELQPGDAGPARPVPGRAVAVHRSPAWRWARAPWSTRPGSRRSSSPAASRITGVCTHGPEGDQPSGRRRERRRGRASGPG